MKISPQDNARLVLDNIRNQKAVLDNIERQHREFQTKSTMDDKIKEYKLERNKFMQEQFQKLIDGIYYEQAQQNSFKMKGTNIDKEV